MAESKSRGLTVLASIICVLLLTNCAAEQEVPLREAPPQLPAATKAAFDEYVSKPKYGNHKAFAVELSGESWGRTWGYDSPESAIDKALQICLRRSYRCELYAVGDIVVFGMSPDELKAKIESEFPSLLQQTLKRYLIDAQYPNFKAFAVDPGRWAWGRAWSYYSPDGAIERALQECRNLAGKNCKVQALGNTVLSSMSEEELAKAKENYLRTVLANEVEASKLANRWMGKRTLQGIEPGAQRSAFDGEWEGTLRCEKCSICEGPLTKSVSIKIENNSFDLIPDLTYLGNGIVDSQGNMSIRWMPATTADYSASQTAKIFQFDGKFSGRSFELQGQRGPEKCKIDFTRVRPETS